MTLFSITNQYNPLLYQKNQSDIVLFPVKITMNLLVQFQVKLIEINVNFYVEHLKTLPTKDLAKEISTAEL